MTLLATSREILGVPGETPFRVPSLAVPDPKHPLALEEITSFDAVRLFLDRAEQAAPGFTLDSANANAVATVCRRLDGIPLAIELAAARTRVMAPQQIADRLDNVFRLLTGGSRSVLPRQQTLKATIDWSYALLSEPERLALQRLSVFAGSWTLEAAEVVVGGEDLEAFEVLDLLTGLVDKSLCSYAGSYRGPVRYRMLETVRQYAHDRLLEAGAGEKVRDCHLEYYLNLAEQAEPNLRGKGMLDWLDRLEEEYDNLRQALEWSLAGHIEEGMRLASSLWWFWHIRPYLEEGVGWLEQVLAVEAERRGTQPLGVGVQSAGYLRAYCRVVVALNELSYIQSGALSLNQRKAMLDESILLCRAVGRDASRELAYALLARGAFMPLEFERSKQYLDESLSLCRQNGYLFIESECLLYLGIQDQDSGEILQAKAHFELSLSISRQIEDFDGVGTRLTGLGSIASILGDRSKALSLFKEGLGYSLPIGNFGFYYLMKVVFLHYQYDQESVSQAEAALLYFRENQALPALVYCLVIFIEVEWSEGNDARADRFGQEAEAILTTQTPLSLIDIYINYYLWRGRLALTRGNRALARQHFKTLLPWVKDDFGVLPVLLSQILDTLAVWFAAEGQMAQSVRLFAAVDEIYRRFELGLVVRQRSEHDSALAAARVALGEEAFARSWQAGQALILWQAIEEVRQAEGWEDNHA